LFRSLKILFHQLLEIGEMGLCSSNQSQSPSHFSNSNNDSHSLPNLNHRNPSSTIPQLQPQYMHSISTNTTIRSRTMVHPYSTTTQNSEAQSTQNDLHDTEYQLEESTSTLEPVELVSQKPYSHSTTIPLSIGDTTNNNSLTHSTTESVRFSSFSISTDRTPNCSCPYCGQSMNVSFSSSSPIKCSRCQCLFDFSSRNSSPSHTVLVCPPPLAVEGSSRTVQSSSRTHKFLNAVGSLFIYEVYVIGILY